VSRCLRGKLDVDAETRSKVQKIAAELGYRLPASRAKMESCTTLGVFIATRPNQTSLYNMYLQGASQAAEKLSALVTVSYAPPLERLATWDQGVSPAAYEPGRLNGSILIYDVAEQTARHLTSLGPCVSIAHEFPGTRLSHVEADNLGGIRAIMERLYSLGHRRIGFVSRRPWHFLWHRRRMAAYLECRHFMGLPEDPSYCVQPDSLDDDAFDGLVADRIIPLIKAGVRAWICVNDPVAALVYTRLVAAGYRIPQDVSITGFDGHKLPLLQTLTSVRLPAAEMGAAATQLLVRQIRNSDPMPQTIVVDVDLIEGETSGPCPV
jgi:LacI family transcriptional regulator